MTASSMAVAAAATIALAGPAMADPDLDQVRDRVERVSERVDDLYLEAEQANERLLQTQEQYMQAKEQLARTRAAVERQSNRVTQMTTELGGFAASAYRQGIVDPTLHLVLSDNPADALSESTMVDAYAGQQVAALGKVAAERNALVAQQADIAESEAVLASLRSEMADEEASLESSAEQAEQLLAGLERREQRILDEIEADRAARAEQAARADVRNAPDDVAATEEPAEEAAPAAAAGSGRGSAAVAFAMAQIGDTYGYGGTGPSMWDCSGLTGGAWAAAGVSVPRTSQAQFSGLPRVSMDALQPGDIVGYYGGVSHVGIYIGNGQIVHASRPGRPVSVAPVYSMPVAGAVRPG
ncbi:MAG: NlpC/P60 family protein [Jiangellales bacterium]